MEQPHAGVLYEETGTNHYLKHYAHLGAEETLGGRTVSDLKPTIDMSTVPSIDACPKCAAAEAQEARRDMEQQHGGGVLYEEDANNPGHYTKHYTHWNGGEPYCKSSARLQRPPDAIVAETECEECRRGSEGDPESSHPLD